MQVSQKDIWTAIWLSENSTSQKASDFLRSLLPSFPKKSTKGKIKLAVVVGHNKKRPGAYAPHPVGQSEFIFNSAVAEQMVKIANGDHDIEVRVFYRKAFNSYSVEIDDVYRRVNAWNPDVAMELHFNWLNQAGRIEMLHYSGSTNGENFANVLLSEFSETMEVRSVKKLKTISRSKQDRGGRSLWACKCPIVLTEPFDCSNNNHLIRVSEVGVKAFAQAYLKSAKSFWNSNSSLAA